MSFNFTEIMQQVQHQMQHDEVIFGQDPENPKKLKVLNPNAIYNREPTTLEQGMIRRIDSVDTYAWNRGKEGGLTTGFPLFDEGMEGGLQPGLILFAASPNVGKSAFMNQVMKNTSELNDSVYCEYNSLDDTMKQLLPRWIACDQKITIAQASNPQRFEDEKEIMERRQEGIKNLYKNVHRFSMRDTNTISEDLAEVQSTFSPSSVEALEERIKFLKIMLPDETRIVIGIDSIFDLTVDTKQLSEKTLYDYIAKFVSKLCDTYDVCIMATAHLRKLNGNRRPTNDDLKETNRLEYEAKLICMLFNEVGIKEEGAEIYWLNEDDEEKMPVLEVRFSKNKFASFKGTRFYEMVPKQSFFMEASVETGKHYASLIHQR
jgi:replicative DNA helicase